MPQNKICSECRTDKPISEFRKLVCWRGDGYRKKCKECEDKIKANNRTSYEEKVCFFFDFKHY